LVEKRTFEPFGPICVLVSLSLKLNCSPRERLS
jgi:hypothetical protein